MIDKTHLDRALSLAFRSHAGQVDKLGEPYIGHVVRVAATVDGLERQCTALLHDVVEDTPVTLAEIASAFPPVIVEAVDAMTRRAQEDHTRYLARVMANPIARDVKLADVADNSAPRRVASLPEADRVRLQMKYEHTKAVLLGEGVSGHANP